MAQYHLPRDRDAYFVIRGFRYQVDFTILRWLELKTEEHLELERGEDIDIVAGALARPCEELSRELQQIKHLESNITLRSQSVVAAIANAVEHRSQNEDLRLTVRFCTNAMPTTERPSPFTDKLPGIEVWELIRRREYEPAELTARIRGIRSILEHLSRPSDFNEATWAEFENFAGSSSEEQLLALIDNFEWSTGQPEADDLAVRVKRHLITYGLSPDNAHATDLHARLFLSVMKLLSQPGRKQLAKADLVELTTLPTLTEQDSALLNFISCELFRLHSRMDEVELNVQRHELAIIAIQSSLQEKIKALGFVGEITDLLPQFSVDPALKVVQLTRRQRTVEYLMNEMNSHTWVAIHGTVGTGKTQLAALVADASKGRVVHVSLRDNEPTHAIIRILAVFAHLTGEPGLSGDLLRRSIGTLPTGSLLIFDDLPRLDGNDDLSRLVMNVALICSHRHVNLFSTSYFPLSSTVKELLPDSLACSHAAPPFSDEEAKELFAAHGAATKLLDSPLVKIINGVAQGNGTMLAAFARRFSSRQWQLSSSELSDLYQASSGSEVVTATIRRLLATLDDVQSREVLYRLSLVIGQFSQRHVRIVADVAPAVDRAGERLTPLLGVWIEQRPNDLMAVSPLVRPLGDSELTPLVRTGIYAALGRDIVSSRTLSVLDVGTACSYLSRGNDYRRLGFLLIGSLNSSDALPIEHLKHLYAIATLYANLPREIDTSIRLLVRTQQVRLGHELNEPIDNIFNEIDHLISECTPEDSWAVFVTAATTSFVAVKSNMDRGLRYCGLALRLQPNVAALLAKKGQSSELGSPPKDMWWSAEILWLLSIGVRSVDDLSRWVEFVVGLDENTLKELFRSNMAEMGSLCIVDRPWLLEVEKPNEHRDWRTIADSMTRIAEVAERRGIELLWAAARRAEVVIKAEYLDEFDSAIDVGTTALTNRLIGPSSRYLLTDIVGRQFVYKKRNQEAMPWLTAALNIDIDGFSPVRLRTCLEASRAVGDEDPPMAIELAKRAVEIGRTHPEDVADIEVAAALSELGLAFFFAGDISSAFIAFNEAAQILLSCKENTKVWKQRFAAFGHAVGYISSIASRGHPPEHSRSGETYAVPPRGTLMSPADALATYYDDQNYDIAGMALFAPIMSMFADGVQRNDEAVRWALMGIDQARSAGMLEAISVLSHQIFPVIVREGRLREAIDIALESSEALVATQVLQEAQSPILMTGRNVGEILAKKPSEEWNRAEVYAANYGVLPCVMEIGRVSFLNEDSGRHMATELEDVCREIAASASRPMLWIQVAEFVHMIFQQPSSPTEIHEKANAANQSGQTTLYLLGYFGCTVISEAVTEAAPVYHGIVFYYLYRTLSHSSPTYRQIALPFLEQYWTRVFAKERFRFSSPNAVGTELEAACKLPSEFRAQAILRAVMSGLKTRLPKKADDVKAWLFDER